MMLVGISVLAGASVARAIDNPEGYTCADFSNGTGGDCPSSCRCDIGHHVLNCHLECVYGDDIHQVYCNSGECIEDPELPN